MKRIKKGILLLAVMIIIQPTASNATQSFDIGFIYGSGASNVLGLGVDPTNNDIFLTSLSYGGQDNLWEFTSNGTFIGSTRANWDTGLDGNLGSITIANNGHLFVDAARDIDPRDGLFERYIVEMSKDGANIFSSFSTTNYFGGNFGITHNSTNDHLLIASGRVDQQFLIRETTLDGNQLHMSVLDPSRWPMDIAFDPITGNILALNDIYLDEYSQNIQGDYKLLSSYYLDSVGICCGGFGLDVNKSNGLIYVNNNDTVWEFNRNELRATPEPTTILLLGSGLFGLAGFGRKRFKK